MRWGSVARRSPDGALVAPNLNGSAPLTAWSAEADPQVRLRHGSSHAAKSARPRCVIPSSSMHPHRCNVGITPGPIGKSTTSRYPVRSMHRSARRCAHVVVCRSCAIDGSFRLSGGGGASVYRRSYRVSAALAKSSARSADECEPNASAASSAHSALRTWPMAARARSRSVFIRPCPRAARCPRRSTATVPTRPCPVRPTSTRSTRASR